MGIILFICVLFTLMVPSFSLPFSIRSSIESGNRLSASVSTGIVIAIFVIFLIPLFWCSYKLGTRARQNPRPLFVSPPPIFPTTPNYDSHSSISSSGHIARPHPVHHKVSNPTYRA